MAKREKKESKAVWWHDGDFISIEDEGGEYISYNKDPADLK